MTLPRIAPVVLVAALAATASAQQQSEPRAPGWVASGIGVVYRYSGDTIWADRDSTSRRTVFRGDTVSMARFRDGTLLSDYTYLLQGDSAIPLGRGGRATPATMLTMDRTSLARTISLGTRPAGLGPDPTAPPRSPTARAVYPVAPDVVVEQLLDTVRYIRRANTERPDTSVFLFVGDTTVRRLSPSPRTFGNAMTQTLIGEMHMSLVRARIDARNPAPPAANENRIIASPIGPVFRYRGDTITAERDSTVRRSIFHGDTVTSASIRNGEVRTEESWVIRGDSATLIAARGVSAAIGSRVAAARATSIRKEALDAQRMVELTAQTGGSPVDPPRRPAEPRSYCISATVNIAQLGDTVRYLRARGAAIDTTTFVFVSDTAVRRLSPSPQQFGLAMANSITGDMRNSLVRLANRSRNAALTATLPGGTATVDGCR